MGVIAHPGEVSNIACTLSGDYLLTAGGPDGAVNQWAITPAAIDVQMKLGGAGLDPFLNLTNDNPDFYRELEDYFYYAQLKSQGENSTIARQISDRVSLDQVPFIMQAVGFYPSLSEIEDMVNEVRFSGIERNEGLVDSITFEELIKCMVVCLQL
jgi:hypothetical protein